LLTSQSKASDSIDQGREIFSLTDLAIETTRERFTRSTEIKTRQLSKIRELGEALVLEGFRTLDQQAKALGLGRSTAWTILKANHKASGLSAAVVNRMLAAPQLPALVRTKILEYIDEKIAGVYGHNKVQLRRFITRLSVGAVDQALLKVEEFNRAPERFVSLPTRRANGAPTSSGAIEAISSVPNRRPIVSTTIALRS